jgi:hypothetical protein
MTNRINFSVEKKNSLKFLIKISNKKIKKLINYFLLLINFY